MRASLSLVAVLAISMSEQSASQAADLAFKNDLTGIHWELPFKSALERARSDKRLLAIKPIAFGTDKDGGW